MMGIINKQITSLFTVTEIYDHDEKKKGVRLNGLQTFTTCTPTFWSGQVSTPKKME
jgi:hypothetical protein